MAQETDQQRELFETPEPTSHHGALAWQFFPHPVVLTDTDDRILSANPAARSLFGRATTDHLWTRMNVSTGVPGTEELMGADGPLPWSGILTVAGTTGNTGAVDLQVRMLPIAETRNGSAARLWIIERNAGAATQEREKQSLALRERAEMAAEIAHDLNNIFAVISGNVELLPMFLGADVSEQVGRCLDNLKKALKTLESFTDSCLRFRHVTNDKTALGVQEFLTDLIAFLRPQKPFRKVTFHCDLPEEPLQVEVNAETLRQVIYQLARRAADAMRDCEGSECCVTFTVGCQSGDQVAIAITDDGDTATAEMKGYIASAESLIRDLNGQLACTPATGRGMVVTLTLPTAPALQATEDTDAESLKAG